VPVTYATTICTTQLKILRQLVELQLCHAPDIKATIDRAWGVQHNKHKKNQAPLPPLDPSDPKSREKLSLQPIGQDTSRKRFWIADGPCTIVLLLLLHALYLFAYICRVKLSTFFFLSGACRS